MVTEWARRASFAASPAHPLLAANPEKAESLLARLDPESRAKVLMALLALVLVGVGLVALAWLWGRHLRRIAGKLPGPSRAHDDDWYRKPLLPREPDSPGVHEPE